MATMFSERVSTQRDRPAECLASQRDDGVLRVGAELRAEGAADVRGDDVHLLGVEPEHRANCACVPCAPWFGHPDGEPAVLAPGRGGGADLQRHRRDALVDDLLGDDDLAPGEEVRRAAGVRRTRRARSCRPPGTAAPRRAAGVLGIDDGGQRVVVDVDQLRGVLALVALLGERRRRPARRRSGPLSVASSGWVTTRRYRDAGGGSARGQRGRRRCRTATTPGASRAAEVSIDGDRPCATGERTKVTCTAPASRSSRRSSV